MAMLSCSVLSLHILSQKSLDKACGQSNSTELAQLKAQNADVVRISVTLSVASCAHIYLDKLKRLCGEDAHILLRPTIWQNNAPV